MDQLGAVVLGGSVRRFQVQGICAFLRRRFIVVHQGMHGIRWCHLFLDPHAAAKGRHLGERHVGRRFGAHWDAVCVFHVRGAAEAAGELRGAGAHCVGAFHAAKWVKQRDV